MKTMKITQKMVLQKVRKPMPPANKVILDKKTKLKNRHRKHVESILDFC